MKLAELSRTNQADLLFLRHRFAHAQQRSQRTLFLEGGPTKWFAGLRNGVGGSVEAGEDVLAAARRECEEETGLVPASLDLAAVVHVAAEPVVMLFVFTGDAPDGDVRDSGEGTLVWIDERDFASPQARLVPDLVTLLPQIAARRPGDPVMFRVSRP